MAKRPGASMTWHWLRHAPSVAAKGTFCGQLDVSAHCADREAFARLAAALGEVDRVIASPLKRSHQTLAALREHHTTLPEHEVCPKFIEQSFGDWEGKAHTDVTALDGLSMQGLAGSRPPGGESFVDVVARVGPAIDAYQDDEQQDRFLVCAHAGVIRAALVNAGVPPALALAFSVAPLSVTTLAWFGGDQWAIEQVNHRA